MKRIEIDVSRTDFEVKKVKEFKLSFKNCSREDYKIIINDSEFILKEMNAFKTICFWMIPKITISIPFNKVETYNVKVEDSTATFQWLKADDINLYTARGSVFINNLECNTCNLACGMGNTSLQGTIQQNANFTCDMGNIIFSGYQISSSYKLKVNSGLITINGLSYTNTSRKQKNTNCESPIFDLNCNMGNITIS